MPLFHNILVPTDLSDVSRKAIAVAAELARANEAKLSVLYVAGGKAVEGNYYDNSATKAEISRLEADEKAVNLQVEEACGQAGRPKNSFVRVASGDAKAAILESAETGGVDLIVMGSHGRDSISDHLLGSMTEHIVARATAAVLVVRPEGYPFNRE